MRDASTQNPPAQEGNTPYFALIICDDTIGRYVLPDRGVVTIGRSRNADICIAHPSVSRLHARIHVDSGGLVLEDLESFNGTRVSHESIPAATPTAVQPSQVIELGAAMLVIKPTILAATHPSGAAPAANPSGRSSVVVKPPQVVVASPAMRDLHEVVERVARSPLTVLIVGEKGAGKEVIAERVHRRSARAAGPYLRFNCAAPTTISLESELFGHSRGAFAGAERDQSGLLERAHGGTVLLDEVGEMDSALQTKLLTAIENKKIQRVGGEEPLNIDVRFVAATHRDLADEVAQGNFNADLYHHLNGITLSVPPLRHRKEEIEPLAIAFADRIAKEMGSAPPPRFSDEALQRMMADPWLGNVHALRTVVERSVILCDGEVIRSEDIQLNGLDGDESPPPPLLGADPSTLSTGEWLRSAIDTTERQKILSVLELCQGNQTRAAKRLGISRRTLLRRMQRHGITPKGSNKK